MATSDKTEKAEKTEKPRKPGKPAEDAPAAPIRAASPPSAGFLALYRIVKVAAMAAGLAATVICLMASIGAITGNGYARFLGALFLAFAVPLAIGDRLLPENDPERAKGIVTETMAVIWVAFGFGFATLLHGQTGGLLVREGDRLQSAGYGSMAAAAYFLGGVDAKLPAAAPAAATSGSASASASASASTDASASGSAAASAPSSAPSAASAAPSASAAPKTEQPEKTPAELFKEMAPAVVTIFVKGERGDGGGTGFLIDKQGTIVTNHHVIDDVRSLKIKLFSGTSYTEAELLEDDSAVDLAILRIDPAKPREGAPVEPTIVTLGDSDKVQVGERAVSIGNPLGLEHTLTDGLVSARRMYEGKAWIQMSVPVSPGNSGGPLFNMRGEVIGITTAQLGGMFGRAQNLNLAVPVNELKKLIKTEYPKKRRFGESANGGRW